MNESKKVIDATLHKIGKQMLAVSVEHVDYEAIAGIEAKHNGKVVGRSGAFAVVVHGEESEYVGCEVTNCTLCLPAPGCDCTESSVLLENRDEAYDAYQEIIDQINAEHAEEKKYDISIPDIANMPDDEPDCTVLPGVVLDDAKNWKCPHCGEIATPSDCRWSWANGWWVHACKTMAVRIQSEAEVPDAVEIGGKVYRLAKIHPGKVDPGHLYFDTGEKPNVKAQLWTARGKPGYAGYYFQWTDVHGDTAHEIAGTDVIYLDDKKLLRSVSAGKKHNIPLRPVAVAFTEN